MNLPRNISPQEVFILERYTSLDYFAAMRDAWASMIEHLELCLDAHMRELPPDYRSRPLPEQPDAVWGELVLPNFRDTLQRLNEGFILLTHGDHNGYRYACGPAGDFRGQIEYWNGWMSDSEVSEYKRLLGESVLASHNIHATERVQWLPTELSSRYDAKNRGALDRPVAGLPNQCQRLRQKRRQRGRWWYLRPRH